MEYYKKERALPNPRYKSHRYGRNKNTNQINNELHGGTKWIKPWK